MNNHSFSEEVASLKAQSFTECSDAERVWELFDELVELVKDLADDAGYNQKEPLSHWCPKEDLNQFCPNCDVWNRIKKLGLKW